MRQIPVGIRGRVDASYHMPVVDAIVAHMKKYAAEITTMSDPRISKNIILAGVFKRTYVQEKYGYPFIGGKEITRLIPQTDKFLFKTGISTEARLLSSIISTTEPYVCLHTRVLP